MAKIRPSFLALAQVEALAAQISQLPEVRQERVEALRQLVGSGQYTPSAESTADAMLAETVEGPAA